MKSTIKFKHSKKSIHDAFNVTIGEYDEMNKAVTVAFISSDKETLSEIAEVVIKSIPFTMRPEHFFILGYNLQQIKEHLKSVAKIKSEQRARSDDDESDKDATVMSRLKELLS